MKVIALKHDDSNAVLVRDTKANLDLWIDFQITDKHDLEYDWNKYIFFLNNPKDLEIREYQASADNFDVCTSVATEYLENKGILEHVDGFGYKWSETNKPK